MIYFTDIPQLKVVPSYSLVEANKSSDSQRLLIEGTRLQLHCIIRAHPPLNSSLIWLLNDQEVNANRCGMLLLPFCVQVKNNTKNVYIDNHRAPELHHQRPTADHQQSER